MEPAVHWAAFGISKSRNSLVGPIGCVVAGAYEGQAYRVKQSRRVLSPRLGTLPAAREESQDACPQGLLVFHGLSRQLIEISLEASQRLARDLGRSSASNLLNPASASTS